MIHDHDNPADTGHQIHGAAHTFDQLAGDHPIGQIAIFRHFHRTEDRHGNLAAANHSKGGCAVKISGLRQFGNRLLARVDQIRIHLIFGWKRSHAEHAVFRLQGHLNPLGDIVGHKRWNPNAQIHIGAIFQLLRGPRGHLVAVPAFCLCGHYDALTVRCSIRFSWLP